MLRTITCSCGSVLHGEDEEQLYVFARAHAAQLHAHPSEPVLAPPADSSSSSPVQAIPPAAPAVAEAA